MEIHPLNLVILLALPLGLRAAPAQPLRTVQVRTANGVLEGVVSADDQVRSFKGIPFAAPPVGSLPANTSSSKAASSAVRANGPI